MSKKQRIYSPDKIEQFQRLPDLIIYFNGFDVCYMVTFDVASDNLQVISNLTGVVYGYPINIVYSSGQAIWLMLSLPNSGAIRC